MVIQPDQIPQIPGDIDVVATHGQTLKTKGKEFSDTGLDVHTTWQGLAAFYSAPEAATLFAATVPVQTKAADVGTGVVGVGGALVTYADTVRPIQARLASLKADAEVFRASVDGDDDWDSDQDKVDKNNDLLSRVNAELAAWQAAQRDCANTINALYGGTHYVQDNGDETQDANEFGFSADQLDSALDSDKGLPWGKSEERDKPWYEDTWDGVASVGKGFFVDGLWGDLKGLGNLVGFGGAEGAKEGWLGIYKLAIMASPPLVLSALALNQTQDLPGIPKGTLFNDYKEMGKGLLAWDTWKEDPARAFGNVGWNAVSVVFGTKGTGAALKVGKVGAIVDKIAGTVRVGGDVVKVEVGGLKVAETAAGKLDDAALKIDAVDPPATPRVDVPETPKVDADVPPRASDVPPRASDGPAADTPRHEPPRADSRGGDTTDGPRRTETPTHERPGADTAEPPRREPGESGGRDTDGPGTRTAHDDPAKPTGRDADGAGRREDAEGAGRRTDDREPALVGAPAREAADAADVPPERSVTHDRSDISDPVEKPAAPENGPTDRGPTASHDAPGGPRTDPDPLPDREPSTSHDALDQGTGDHATGDLGGKHGGDEPTPHEPDGSSSEPPSGTHDTPLPSDGWEKTPLQQFDPLPDTARLPVTKDADGLISTIDGKPVDQFVHDVVEQRGKSYLEHQKTGDVPRSGVGPVVSVVYDRVTGRIYEGTNKLAEQPLHPVLQERLDALDEAARTHPDKYDYGANPKTGLPDKGGYPHFSDPGTHAEIKAVNQALWDREAMGLPVNEQSLRSLTVDNVNPYGRNSGAHAPYCQNCDALLRNTDGLAGGRDPNEYLSSEHRGATP